MSFPRTRLGANATAVAAHANGAMDSSAVAPLCSSTRHTLTRLSRAAVANASWPSGAHLASYSALACALTRVASVQPLPQAPAPVPSATEVREGT